MKIKDDGLVSTNYARPKNNPGLFLLGDNLFSWVWKLDINGPKYSHFGSKELENHPVKFYNIPNYVFVKPNQPSHWESWCLSLAWWSYLVINWLLRRKFVSWCFWLIEDSSRLHENIGPKESIHGERCFWHRRVIYCLVGYSQQYSLNQRKAFPYR